MAKEKSGTTKIPKGALKNFLDAGKSTTRVVGKVERFVLAKPHDNSRSYLGLHPSSMVSKWWCHRASYFHLLGHRPAPEDRSFKRELVFAQGNAIHETWQNWFRDMGKLYGKWECPKCGFREWSTSPTSCLYCEQDELPMRYREVPVEHADLRITGHADGWLKGFGDDLLLEIKSVGVGTLLWLDRPGFMEADQDFEKYWKNLRTPFESHISQVQLYMKVLELSGVENVPQEAVVIYEAKPTQEVKEFIIKKDDWGISHLIDAARMIVESIDNNTPPDCNIGGIRKCRQCEGFTDE